MRHLRDITNVIYAPNCLNDPSHTGTDWPRRIGFFLMEVIAIVVWVAILNYLTGG